MRSILRIKIMVWAYDFPAAKGELFELERVHGGLLREALGLKTDMLSHYRNQPQKAEEEGKIFSGFTLRGTRGDALYVLGPLASTISHLDKRIAENTGTRSIFTSVVKPSRVETPVTIDRDERTGITFCWLQVEDDSWEVRLYRLDNFSVDLDILIKVLGDKFRARIKLVEQATEGEYPTFPFLLKGFGDSIFFEMSFFDRHRSLFQATINDENISRAYIMDVLRVSVIFASGELF